MPDFLFKVKSPLNFQIRTTLSYWNYIITNKHPSVRNHIEDIKKALEEPEVIRKSKKDDCVLLFYREMDSDRKLCVVVKKMNGEGFLVTAYFTGKIKIGELVWKK